MDRLYTFLLRHRDNNFIKPIISFGVYSRKIFYRTIALVFGPLFAGIARHGYGSAICLKLGFLPIPVYGFKPTPVHFYSPIPNVASLQRRKIWDNPSKLLSIDFSVDRQREFLKNVGGEYGQECAWSTQPTTNPIEFSLANDSFSFGCAASLHGVIRYAKPHRFIEVGSGNSTKVIAAALEKNRLEGHNSQYTIIDPYAAPIVIDRSITYATLLATPVEETDVRVYEQLEAKDILFIDSGHVVRIGGDVNYLFLEVLPRLKPGVIVHIHDINLPNEVSEIYATSEVFRQFWTEQYLLQAFLSYNKEFRVLLAMGHLMSAYPHDVRQAFPQYDPTNDKKISGSFWMQRRPALV